MNISSRIWGFKCRIARRNCAASTKSYCHDIFQPHFKYTSAANFNITKTKSQLTEII